MKRKNTKMALNSFLLGNKAVLIVIALIIIMSILSPVFLTPKNMLNVLRQICINTIVASAFTLILGCGEIDISIGGIVGLTGIIMAQLMVKGVSIPFSIFLGVILGIVLGLINAFFITAFKLAPFIVTLSTQLMLRGVCYLVTGMVPVTKLPEKFSVIGQGFFLKIPIPVYIMVVAVALIWVIGNRSKFGRYVLAMGGNKEATRVCGININKVRFGVYALLGAFCAIAAVVMTARSSSAQPTAGINLEGDIIAATVIGGSSMSGGSVNIVGAFFGCLIVGIVNNGMNLLGVNSNWQVYAKGAMILFAVVLDNFSAILYARTRKV